MLGFGALVFWYWIHIEIAETREERQKSWPCASYHVPRDVPLRCLPNSPRETIATFADDPSDRWPVLSKRIKRSDMTHEEDHIALVDLDGTVADCDGALRDAMETLRSPDEPARTDTPIHRGTSQDGSTPARILAELEKDPAWLRSRGRASESRVWLHVLSKGPRKNGSAWGEKLEWSIEHLPDATVTVTGDKSASRTVACCSTTFPPYFPRVAQGSPARARHLSRPSLERRVQEGRRRGATRT